MALPATRTRRLDAISAWAPGTLLATALAVAYVALAPASADLAAAEYRSHLFARRGFSLWDNGWYAGHHLPGYSLLAPPLGALLTPQLVIAVAVIVATALFGMLAERLMGLAGGRWATPAFAVAMTGQALAGRVPFALGVAVALAALLCLAARRVGVAFALALLCTLASPVAGFFLALVGLAVALTQRASRAAGAALLAGAALPVLVLSLAFPEGGYEPFAFSDLGSTLLGDLALVAVLGLTSSGRRRRGWIVGAALYALACVAAFAVHTPLGTNVTRLGPLVAAGLVAGALGPRRGWSAAAGAAAGLAWALVTPINDLLLVAGDPSVGAAYYRPLLAELGARADGAPVRIEIPLTGTHWESVHVPERVPLARGWERQLDTRDAPLFYRPALDAANYHRWLQVNAVAYVAVPDVRLDYSADAEARLVAGGLAYLVPVWRSAHWRLYAVRSAAPLVSPPGALRSLDSAGFALSLPRPGSYTVAVRFTPYWSLKAGRGCVSRAPGGWTRVSVPVAAPVRVGVAFSFARVLSRAPRCR
jgi:hypothetical protein